MGAVSAFRQTDLTRAIKAARAAGMRPHVWIGTDGVIHIVEAGDAALTAAPAPAPSDEPDEWDLALNP